MSEASSHEPLSTAELRDLQAEVSVSGIVPSWCGQYPPGVAPVRREGFSVWTPDGQELLDLHQAILSMSVGWANPRIERAVAEFKRSHPGIDMVDTTQFFAEALLLLQDLQRALAPHGKFRGFLGSSGTAVNDQNIRLCMGALGGEDRTQLITMEGCYGGAGLAMNAECRVPGWKGKTSLHARSIEIKRDGSNVVDVFRAIPTGKSPLWHVEDGQQGVGGFYVYYIALMRYIAEEVRKRDGRIILDNVQDFVRNGKGLLGVDRWGAPANPAHRPDAVTFAKGLGNGRPIAAGMVSEDVLQACKSDPGSTFDTFSQPADGVIAAREVLAIVLEERLWENVARMGLRFTNQLRAIAERFPSVIEAVVGEGGLIGIQLRTAQNVVDSLMVAPGKGVIMAKGGLKADTLRTPLPFNATEKFVDEASQRLEDVMKAVAA